MSTLTTCWFLDGRWRSITTTYGRCLIVLRGAGLRLKPKKCTFAQPSVEYLGHVVSAEGIHTDPRKLQAVRNYPAPMDLKSLRSFLGLCSYYRRFVPGFSKVAAPLHALTRKDVGYVWTQDCQESFEKLRDLLVSAPLLSYPDFQKPFILETDASGEGLGAVLAQRQDDGSVKPIAYASRSLQKHERNYGVTELEGLGVVWAAKHFRPYLYGHPCQVFTDHEALKSLLNTPQPSGKLARWGMQLQELDLTIQHRSGKSNANADALSRHPLQTSLTGSPDDIVIGGVFACTSQDNTTVESPGDEPTLASLDNTTVESPGDEPTLASLQRADSELKPLVEYLETGTLPAVDKDARKIVLGSPQYTLEDGILYRVEGDGTLRVVPPTDMREGIFTVAHGGRFGAHLGEAKVYSEMRRHYWWGGMRRDISRWTRGCIVCATRNVGRAVKVPLTPIPVSGPFDRVGVDVIQFPRSRQGHQYAVVFVDYLTKWPEVFPVADQSATTIADLLVKEIVSRHGVPSEVLSDRGKAFLSGLMQEVQKLLGFRKANTTAYHPQTDGLVERFNRTLTAMLAKTVDKKGPDWDEILPYVLFAYRACQQSSTQESPFFLLYGRDPRLPSPAILSPKETRAIADLKEYGIELHSRMSEAWELARQQITRAQQHQKHMYDRDTKKVPFRTGERVFLFKPAEQTGTRRKFARPFHGPYRLVEVDTNTAKIRPVDQPESEPLIVSLGRLRRCPGEVEDTFWPPPNGRPGRRKARKDKKLGQTQASTGAVGEKEDTNPQGGGAIGSSVQEEESRPSPEQKTGEESTAPQEDHSPSAQSGVSQKGATLDSSPSTVDDHGYGGPAPGEGYSDATDSQRKKRGSPEDSAAPPGRWAGRLRGCRSPRTTTRQQGEV